SKTAPPVPGGPGGSPEASGPLLSVSGISRSYGPRRAVDDVSFELAAGVTGLLGPNGAGKTTLISCLAGIAPWDEGTVRIDGIDLARSPNKARQRIGFMPERVAFPGEQRVDEHLRFVAAAKGIARRGRAGAVDEALATTGLDEVRGRIIANLSKGWRQRVGLARALLGQPPVVILDEPTAGLDPLSLFEIRDLLAGYARTRAVLVATHHLADARLMCDRVVVMSRGSVVYDGAPSAMAGTTNGRVRMRLRLGGSTEESPTAALPGIDVVHCQPGPDGVVLAVDAENEEAVGTLVRHLAQRWLVLGVEPTMDALEDAFRRAVVGTTDVDTGEGQGAE
ncbi:MAG: ABC transporter ATP-binding protein, partial [Acidimicrobiia bacterium]